MHIARRIQPVTRALTALVLTSGLGVSQNRAAAAPDHISVVRAQHQRLTIPADIQRTAVGDENILEVLALSNRELLLLGKSSGRTSLLVWLRDGTVREYLVSVHRDFSLLQTTLKRIHPSIEAEVAPDRDAVVLTGRVPDISYYRAAEAAAQNYLNAAQATAVARVLVQATQPATAAPEGAQPTATPPAAAPPSEAIRVPAQPQASGTVINLIEIENLPPLVEYKMGSSGILVGAVR